MLSALTSRVSALTLVILSASSNGALSAPQDKTKLPIEGKWLVTFFAIQFNRVSPGDTGDTITVESEMTLTIRDGKMTISAGSGSFTWKVDRVEYKEGKHGEIDLIAETAKLSPQKGIFSLDKDVLVLRYPPNAADRPKELNIKPNEQGVLLRAKRIE